jgi:hypothetical protein
LATFPRYNVLKAILIELERLDPANLPDAENTRALLILAGEIAEDVFTEGSGEIDKRAMGAMAEERDAFCRHMRELKLADLYIIEELPYRRVLRAEESKSIWSRLSARWGILDRYWYPMGGPKPSDVEAFEGSAFDDAFATVRLQDILRGHGIRHVWELREHREYGPEYEENVSLLEASYNGAEGYWSSGDLEWIIYASHHRSVTVGGWLLPEVQALWHSWQAHIWTG